MCEFSPDDIERALGNKSVASALYDQLPEPKMCEACVLGEHERCSYKHCACRKRWHDGILLKTQ